MPAGFYKEGLLQPYSTETWADYGDSVGYTWDNFTSWNGTPDLPLTFDTGIVDGEKIDQFLPLTEVTTTGQVTQVTIYYGNTVDSTGGAIDSESSVTYTPGDSVNAIKARYFRFSFSVGYLDSAGVSERPVISNIVTSLSNEKITATFDSIDSSTLGGSVGARELTVEDPITVTSLTVTPHTPGQALYVSNDYVASDDSAGEIYVEEGITVKPIIYINKTTSPITLNIYNFDTYGKNAPIDCTFDAMVQGLPNAIVDVTGNIRS